MNTILAIDFDKWAAETYRANFPGVRVECGPVASFIDTMPYADILLGGPPCQPFSTAGEGGGEDDERDCIPDFIASVRRVKPRMFLMENVRGLITRKHYQYFCAAVEQLADAGYITQWRLLDSVSFGVPQFRERVWVWGIRKDLYVAGMRHAWPVVTHEWPPPVQDGLWSKALLPGVTTGQALGLDCAAQSPRRNPNPESRQSIGTNEPVSTLLSQKCGDMLIRQPRGPEWQKLAAEHTIDEPSPTVPAGSKSGGGDTLTLSVDDRRATESAHADHPRTIDLPAPTLRSGGNGHDGCCLRIIGGGANQEHPGANRIQRDITDEPSTTLATDASNAMLIVCIETPELFIRRMRGKGMLERDGGRRDHQTVEPSPSITGGGGTPLYWHATEEPRPWTWSNEMLAKQAPISLDQPSATIVKNWHKGWPYGCLKWKQTPEGLWIRRLHPLECARLQSVPDDFVWPDDLPKTHAYRIIGNGWSSRMGQVFAEAFRKVDPESSTVIDLFCGGGLGAFGWHRGAWTYTGMEVAA